MSARDRLIATISDFFTQAGLEKVDVPILQPAEPFLDSVGEDLRRRIFMTENEHGDLLCLRPEFTIPVCLAHIRQEQTLPHRYAYLGEVFRQRRMGESSFYQAGIEDLGEPDEIKADVGSLKDAFDLLRLIAPEKEFQIIIGDHGIFDALLLQLRLTTGWRRRLRGCFGNPSRLHAEINELSHPPSPLELPSDIAQALLSDDEKLLTELIEAQLYEAGLPLHTSRSANEIVQRLREKAAQTRQPLGLGTRRKLEEFLNIHVPLSQATDTIRTFIDKIHLDLEEALAQFEARIAAMRACNLDIGLINYDAAFGRSLDYYTGFIYEIRYGTQILVGGGRYDHLLHLLGAYIPIPAVGFSLWLDRLEQFSQEAALGQSPKSGTRFSSKKYDGNNKSELLTDSNEVRTIPKNRCLEGG